MLFICFQNVYAQSFSNCKVNWTEQSPFSIIQVSNNSSDQIKLNQNEISLQDNSKEHLLTEHAFNVDGNVINQNYKIIKKGAIVTTSDSIANSENLIKVKVRSTGAADQYDQLLKGEVVQKNETVFVPAGTLRKIQDQDAFLVKETTKAFSFSKARDQSLLKNQALRPVQKNGKFKIYVCENNGQKIAYYAYELINQEGEDLLIPGICNKISTVPLEQASQLQKLVAKIADTYDLKKNDVHEKIEVNEWGLVRLVMDDDQKLDDEIMGRSPNKSFVHYQGSDPHGSDTWIEPKSYCGLINLTEGWKKICSGANCTPQIGDISFRTPSKVQGKITDPLGHRHHASGTCVDVRPFRNDSQFKGVTITDPTGLLEYNRKTTAEFLKYLISQNIGPIYFNDQELVAEYGPKINQSCNLEEPEKDIGRGLLYCQGHDNHIHFCFNEKSNQECK